MDRPNNWSLLHVCRLLVEQLKRSTIHLLSIARLDLLPLSIISALGEGCLAASDGPSRAQSETRASARLCLADFPGIGVWTVDVLFHPPLPPDTQHVNQVRCGLLARHLETSFDSRTWTVKCQFKLWAPHTSFSNGRRQHVMCDPCKPHVSEWHLRAPCSSRPDVTAGPVSYD